MMCKKKDIEKKKYKKKPIPKALREQVWLNYAHQVFEMKCPTAWCQNRITAFDFHCGHILAEANGGSTTINNLIPICSRCNLSMGTKSFNEWSNNFVYSSINKPAVIGETLIGPAHYTNRQQQTVVAVKPSKRGFCC
jgi:hypothetical protein